MDAPLDHFDKSKTASKYPHSLLGIISTALFIFWFLITFGMPFIIEKYSHPMAKMLIGLFIFGGFINILGIILGIIALRIKKTKKKYAKICLWCHGIWLGILVFWVIHDNVERLLNNYGYYFQ